ncbi:DUF1684 domain-containing protein [Spirosoma endophyticum]|uniref:DUF1684 domain-containing protein n=1 Tax=Spirosoma endophyticum TaxID=662367 RepID=A0A1I1Q3L8_9BACT|nr:DUF1684 domain-containing protein [Spirosoma endophyticum]SFD16552.1 hypothetical protein SAMN05216167_103585 [Spirosoma endophyticum]
MKRINKPAEPLNLYSGLFFGVWLLAMVASAGFRQASESHAAGVRSTDDGPAYKAQIDEWHQKRVNSLKSENGWLNLAGLFWLKEGKNSLGRGSDFDVPFPEASGPAELGQLVLEKGDVRFIPKAGANVLADGKPITESVVVFSPNSKPAVLENGSLRWVIIKRGDKYGIRLRDLESPFLKEFTTVERYPVDETWKVKAKLEKPATPRTIPILNVLGQVTPTPLAGTLVFEKDGKTYRLDAVGEEGKLFILFSDPTNAHDTYGAGRFLYADRPAGAVDSDGLVTLDFNQAINPPCAFTPYATCPLPPKQNTLALNVTAGEKRYGDH